MKSVFQKQQPYEKHEEVQQSSSASQARPSPKMPMQPSPGSAGGAQTPGGPRPSLERWERGETREGNRGAVKVLLPLLSACRGGTEAKAFACCKGSTTCLCNKSPGADAGEDSLHLYSKSCWVYAGGVTKKQPPQSQQGLSFVELGKRKAIRQQDNFLCSKFSSPSPQQISLGQLKMLLVAWPSHERFY